jgi:cytochrome c biogenesis protein
MKKVLSFLRSMKFGLILLGLILICSIVGSLIPQGEAASVYQERYGWASALLALQFDHIFTSWYFILISALMCVNLSL